MNAALIIAKLRDGQMPNAQELQWFAIGLANGQVSDAQAGAFAMAVFLNGLGDESAIWTAAMRDSGQVLDWDLDGPVLDKHSTGGVGDCVSLLLAPTMAACGAYVPMISGRGLGHTGGTLDKLEAIPGVRVDLDEAKFRAVVGDVGCAIVSASKQIAPADKRLYAVRDVTGTVESLDLIVSSILSKKLAAGLDGLLMDVKLGTGAFMKDLDQARALAQALVETGTGAGCPTRALITRMDGPLAGLIGNALEVRLVCDTLLGAKNGLAALIPDMCGDLLHLGGLADSIAIGADIVRRQFSEICERFNRMIAAQGGPTDFMEKYKDLLPKADTILDVHAPCDGYLGRVDGQALGLIAVGLGAGRKVEIDTINPAVGLTDIPQAGTKLVKGDRICRVHAGNIDAAQQAAKAVIRAMDICDTPFAPPPQIIERIG